MHHARKFMRTIRQFFAPSIPYSLVVNESPENCLRKIQSKIPILSKEITTDEQGNPHFKLHIARTDPETIPSMIVTGKVEFLDTQKTLVSGNIRSWVLAFMMFLIVIGGGISLIAGIGNGNSTVIGIMLFTMLFFFFTYFRLRRETYLWLTYTLQYVLES